MSPNQMAAALTLLGWELIYRVFYRRMALVHRGHRMIAWGACAIDMRPYWNAVIPMARGIQTHYPDEEAREWIGQGIDEFELGAAYDLIMAWEQKR